MAIRPPAWCAGAVPELNKGWVDPNSGELLVSSRFTQSQIDEFYGVPSFADVQEINEPEPKPEPAPEFVAEPVIEITTNQSEIVIEPETSEEVESK